MRPIRRRGKETEEAQPDPAPEPDQYVGYQEHPTDNVKKAYEEINKPNQGGVIDMMVAGVKDLYATDIEIILQTKTDVKKGETIVSIVSTKAI